MMGKRVFAPKLYYQLSLDQLVPENHLLRQIATAVDFSFIYPLAKSHYSHTGQPSVDPVVIFKTMLIGDRRADETCVRQVTGFAAQHT